MTELGCPICRIAFLGELCPLCKGHGNYVGQFYKYVMDHNLSKTWKQTQLRKHPPYLVAVSTVPITKLEAITHDFQLLCTKITKTSIEVDSVNDKIFPWYGFSKTFLPDKEVSALEKYDFLYAYVAYEDEINKLCSTNRTDKSLYKEEIEGMLIKGKKDAKGSPHECPAVLFIDENYSKELSDLGNGYVYVNEGSVTNGLSPAMGSRATVMVDCIDLRVFRRFGISGTAAYMKVGCPEGDGGIFAGERAFYGGINPVSLAIRTTHSVTSVFKSKTKQNVSKTRTNWAALVGDCDDACDYYEGRGNWSTHGHYHADAYGYDRTQNYVPRSKKAHAFGPALAAVKTIADLEPFQLLQEENTDGEDSK